MSQWVDNRAPEPVRFSLRSLFTALFVASILLGALSLWMQREVRRQRELESLAKLDAETRQQIVKDVEAIRLKLGRAPKDEAELVSLMGKPMPMVHEESKDKIFRINYYQTGEHDYRLSHLCWSTPGDYLIYESKTPKAGWLPFSN